MAGKSLGQGFFSATIRPAICLCSSGFHTYTFVEDHSDVQNVMNQAKEISQTNPNKNNTPVTPISATAWFSAPAPPRQLADQSPNYAVICVNHGDRIFGLFNHAYHWICFWAGILIFPFSWDEAPGRKEAYHSDCITKNFPCCKFSHTSTLLDCCAMGETN